MTVPRRQGAVRHNVPTSPVLLEYTRYMRGVDVADQLRASYSSQTRSHKWWHRVFWFLMDTSIVNAYILYLDLCRRGPNPRRPHTHLDFKTTLCQELLRCWELRSERAQAAIAYHVPIHMLSYGEQHRNCIVCGARVHSFCIQCGVLYFCSRGRDCYEVYHRGAHRPR